MKEYQCPLCGYSYDPAAGDPENGVAPGTAFENLPDSWYCPACGIGLEQYKSGRKKSAFGAESMAAIIG